LIFTIQVETKHPAIFIRVGWRKGLDLLGLLEAVGTRRPVFHLEAEEAQGFQEAQGDR
jgi:hypothetical protein